MAPDRVSIGALSAYRATPAGSPVPLWAAAGAAKRAAESTPMTIRDVRDGTFFMTDSFCETPAFLETILGQRCFQFAETPLQVPVSSGYEAR
jgi:hypothetical protein